MDEEKFRQDTMLGIARIEAALVHLGERIHVLETTCKTEDAKIIEELRSSIRKAEEECNRKRKNLMENLTSSDSRCEASIRDALDALDARVRVLEERVLGVEMHTADKTTTHAVVSLEAKIDILVRDIGDIKVEMGKLQTRVETLDKTIVEVKESGWKKIQTALTIGALLLSILALSFNVLKEVFKPSPAAVPVVKQIEPDK